MYQNFLAILTTLRRLLGLLLNENQSEFFKELKKCFVFICEPFRLDKRF